MKLFTGIALLLCLAPLAPAGTLELDKTGGGALAVTTLSLTGSAGQPYLILFDISEQQTVINPQVTLDISLTYAPLAVQVPGFLGVLNGAGKAQVSFVIPNDPVILDLTISLQAIGGFMIDSVSNLVRLTPSLTGAFEAALDNPALPITGGAIHENADGTLLLVGGSGPTYQTYDPDREEFDLGGLAFGVGFLGQSTALADGRYLFTGGLGLDGQPTAAAAVFDPATGTTTNVTMLQPRAGHGASLMPNGKVLITGGFKVFTLTDILAFLQGIQGDTEIFDPAAGAFGAGPAMLEPRALHTSTAMPNGKVLVAGGLTLVPILNIPLVSNTAYSYNPIFNTFGLPIFFTGARLYHSAALLSDGRVLLAGGLSMDLTEVISTGDITKLVISTLSDCQIFKATIFGGGFTTASALSQPRAGAGVIGLADGGALIAGGFNLSLSSTAYGMEMLSSADRFASSGALSATGSLLAARLTPVLHKLNDGTILAVGGGPTSAEIYQP